MGETLPMLHAHRSYFDCALMVGSTNLKPNYGLEWLDRCVATYFLPGTSSLNHARDASCNFNTYGFDSMHPNGLQVAMTDGSVTFINDTIEYAIWQYLGDKDDGNAMSGY